MLKKSLVIALCLIVAGLAFAGGEKEKAAVQKQVELKFSHVLPTNEPLHQVAVEIAKALEARSNGSIKSQVYPNTELGNNRDNLEQIRRGANIILLSDPGNVADYVPDYSIMAGPFLYKDYKDVQKLAATKWHQEMIKQSAEKGIKILAMDWYFGSRHMISDKVIRTPDDMKGMKVRVPPNKMWIETIKAMGGSPTTLQWSEVYSGLTQGVVDAAEAPLSTLFGSKLFEAKKKIALTGHFKAAVGLQMSQKVFDSLSPEQQKILTEEIAKGGIEATKRVVDSESEWRKKLEAQGVVFNEVDQAAFEKACQVVYTQFPAWSAGLYDRIKTELK
jgi:TRAP-type transport system periplasmic protein